jgi:hypothetical protein
MMGPRPSKLIPSIGGGVAHGAGMADQDKTEEKFCVRPVPGIDADEIRKHVDVPVWEDSCLNNTDDNVLNLLDDAVWKNFENRKLMLQMMPGFETVDGTLLIMSAFYRGSTSRPSEDRKLSWNVLTSETNSYISDPRGFKDYLAAFFFGAQLSSSVDLDAVSAAIQGESSIDGKQLAETIQVQDSTDSEKLKDISNWVKRWFRGDQPHARIGNPTQEQLRNFLRWVTGSSAFNPKQPITFTTGGFCLLPKVHTCSCQMDWETKPVNWGSNENVFGEKLTEPLDNANEENFILWFGLLLKEDLMPFSSLLGYNNM